MRSQRPREMISAGPLDFKRSVLPAHAAVLRALCAYTALRGAHMQLRGPVRTSAEAWTGLADGRTDRADGWTHRAVRTGAQTPGHVPVTSGAQASPTQSYRA